MNKSTSNDILRISNATKEQIENFKLSKHLLDLLMEEPFYSRIIRSLNKVETTNIPTAGVLCQDGELTLWWNRKFLAGLEHKEVKGLLKHECLHLVFEHTSERKKDPHLIWNYSTDLAINSIIPYDELPKGGLVPGHRLPPLSPDELEKMDDSAIENYNHISEIIYNLPPNKTSEFYFEILMKDDKIKSYAESNSGGGISIGFDDHEGWGDFLDDAEKEILKEKIKEILKDSIKEADTNGWGSISHNHRKDFYRLVERKIKWEDILKRFCGFTRRDERRSSNKRLNRKYPGIHPGIKKLYRPMIAVYIDESGSMDDDSLNRFYNELNVLSKFTDFYVYKFDSEVQEKEGFLWKKGKSVKLRRGMCGGTCFKSVTKHAIKNKKLFDGYIIFTDGCAPKPPTSRGVKRCWILIPDYKLSFSKDKHDVLINMK
tara:strand:- start:15098 stop:16387 length:1290 start_codon:yes stop_codon:yes gene_type:complete